MHFLNLQMSSSFRTLANAHVSWTITPSLPVIMNFMSESETIASDRHLREETDADETKNKEHGLTRNINPHEPPLDISVHNGGFFFRGIILPIFAQRNSFSIPFLEQISSNATCLNKIYYLKKHPHTIVKIYL